MTIHNYPDIQRNGKVLLRCEARDAFGAVLARGAAVWFPKLGPIARVRRSLASSVYLQAKGRPASV